VKAARKGKIEWHFLSASIDFGCYIILYLITEKIWNLHIALIHSNVEQNANGHSNDTENVWCPFIAIDILLKFSHVKLIQEYPGIRKIQCLLSRVS
jgi:hypothetical protein